MLCKHNEFVSDFLIYLKLKFKAFEPVVQVVHSNVGCMNTVRCFAQESFFLTRRHLYPFSSERHLSCDTQFETGPRFLWSQSSEKPPASFVSYHTTVVLNTYFNQILTVMIKHAQLILRYFYSV